IWQDVTVRQSGPVSLSDARVTTALALPGLGSADVTVKVDAHNTTDAAVTATISGTVDDIAFTANANLAAGATKTITFNPASTPGLRISRPRVWWPTPLGDHPLYQLNLTASVDNSTSDTAQTTFGIRDVKSTLDGSGHRAFSVNGKPVLIRSGGWASDMFLRTDVNRLQKQFEVVRDLGLNSIRLEGKLETDGFYDLADKFGILLLPGWECCDKWQDYGSWSSADFT